ncbi:MAG: amidohydrolase [Acholeplasmataceae bacterium]
MKKYINATFYTMQKEAHVVHEVITDNGLIKAIGQACEDILVDEVIDLKGAFVFPGFVDAHLHIMGYGHQLSTPSLKHVTDKLEALDRIKKAYQGSTLLIEDYQAIGITHIDLDAISKDQFIVLRHQDYHSVTANSKVLEHFNVPHQAGMVFEADAQKITNYFANHSESMLENLLKKSLQSLVSYGLTGGHSDDLYYFGGYQKTLNAFKNVIKTMPFRTQLLVHHAVLDDFIASEEPFLDVDQFIQMGPVKMFYDGTMGSQTAYLKHNYKNTNTRGLKAISPTNFEGMIMKCRSHHLPVAIHVIGDQALEDVCQLLYKHPVKKGCSDRLIHTPWFEPDALEMMKRIPLFIDAQPQFLSADMPWAKTLFSKEPRYQFAWKTMIDYGLNVGFSSDAPVEIPNPLLGIYDAVERKSSHDHQVYQPEEKVSRYEAIKAYTITPNLFTYHTNRGMIKEGFIADFTGFKKDLFKIDINDFKDDLVALTIIDDKIVYKAKK